MSKGFLILGQDIARWRLLVQFTRRQERRRASVCRKCWSTLGLQGSNPLCGRRLAVAWQWGYHSACRGPQGAMPTKPATVGLTLSISPHGRAIVERKDEDLAPSLSASEVERIQTSFSAGESAGLLHLATKELQTALPA